MADDTTCLPSTARYWDVQHRLTVLNLSNGSQVQQRPHVVVGADESQANCWQKATPKVSLFSCFEKFRTVQYTSVYLHTLLRKLLSVPPKIGRKYTTTNWGPVQLEDIFQVGWFYALTKLLPTDCTVLNFSKKKNNMPKL